MRHRLLGNAVLFAVCTSKDKRNPEPSETELEGADFFFNCTFDVGKRVIVHEFKDEIDGVKVEHFFNGTDPSEAEARTLPHKKRLIIREMSINTWDDRLHTAQGLDTLVLLTNLDPSYSSCEVEDLVWHALNKKVEARMIEWSPTYNTHYGRALVIFETKDAAEDAIFELNRRCLILRDGRVISAENGTLRNPGDSAAPQSLNTEMGNAVSSSHCSQPNRIDYRMALEWLLQYKKSDGAWTELYQEQMKEIDDKKNRLNMDRIFVS